MHCQIEIGEQSPYFISSGSIAGENVTVSTLLFTQDIPEYPQSADDGVCYVINVQGRAPADIKRLIDNVFGMHCQ